MIGLDDYVMSGVLLQTVYYSFYIGLSYLYKV